MTITRSNLFEFLSGWDFQPEAERLQVIKDFYISEPDATETAYSALDWDALPPVVRESLIDASTETGVNEYACGCVEPTGEAGRYYDHACASCHRANWTRKVIA